jgi:hypothetical protein
MLKAVFLPTVSKVLLTNRVTRPSAGNSLHWRRLASGVHL